MGCFFNCLYFHISQRFCTPGIDVWISLRVRQRVRIGIESFTLLLYFFNTFLWAWIVVFFFSIVFFERRPLGRFIPFNRNICCVVRTDGLCSDGESITSNISGASSSGWQSAVSATSDTTSSLVLLCRVLGPFLESNRDQRYLFLHTYDTNNNKYLYIYRILWLLHG